ncbi:hypothetical protein ACFE04_011280 [Oxalis oulophora]
MIEEAPSKAPITKASTLSLFDKANPKTAVRSNEMNLTPKAIQQKPSSPPPVNANNQFVDVGVLMTNPPNMNLLVLKPEGFGYISQSVEELVVQVKDTFGRVEEEIELLERSSGGRKKKNARAQGEKVFNTLEQERSRKLDNMACEYLHLDKYEISKRYYGRVVFLEPNRNKPCNFAICLMKMKRALLMLGELRTRNYNNESDTGRAFLVPTDLESNFDSRKVPAEDYMVKSNPPPKKSWLDMVEEDEEEFKDEHFDYNEFAWSFMHPVDVKGLNLDDYYEIIERSMDFSTKKKKNMKAKDCTGYKNVYDMEFYCFIQ